MTKSPNILGTSRFESASFCEILSVVSGQGSSDAFGVGIQRIGQLLCGHGLNGKQLPNAVTQAASVFDGATSRSPIHSRTVPLLPAIARRTSRHQIGRVVASALAFRNAVINFQHHVRGMLPAVLAGELVTFQDSEANGVPGGGRDALKNVCRTHVLIIPDSVRLCPVSACRTGVPV